MRVRISGVGALAAGAIVATLLVGCTSGAEPVPTESKLPTSAPSAVPTFDPDADADDALIYFDSVNQATLGTNADADGRAFIDGLVAAGFDRAAMEVTSDSTTIGNAADSIQFSVRWGESCLIGQNGDAVSGYHSTVGPALGTGTCLIGSTRPIDW